MRKENEMLIAVAAKSSDPNSEVYSRFCTARCFHVINTGTHETEVVENIPECDPLSKVETRAAGLVMEKGVDMVLAGLCGPNAYRCLCAAGIQLIMAVQGKVQDVVDSLHIEEDEPMLCDEDECPTSPDAESWWNWR